MSIDGGIDKEVVGHTYITYIYNGILISHKKKNIMWFATTWMDLETAILSEVRERQIWYYITYIWNIKKNTNELDHKTDTE